MAEKKVREVRPGFFLNGEVHHWYNIILGYNDDLVAHLIEQFKLTRNDLVLDPFCGAGTTLVECMRSEIPSIGVDANPSSCFAARVKTDWELDTRKIEAALDDLSVSYRRLLAHQQYKSDLTYCYITDSGMVERGWISEVRLIKAIALKKAIAKLNIGLRYQNFFKLALISEVVQKISNVKFGPELYCGPHRENRNLFKGFATRVQKMCADLEKVAELTPAMATVIQDDSRSLNRLPRTLKKREVSAIICSPPYPAEHDYTRNTRLELAFLEDVTGLESLRKIKKRMMRSHTKGIYKKDDDGAFVKQIISVQDVVRTLEPLVKEKTHGFAKLYPKVVGEYFGGMARHFASVAPYLKKGAQCAYVVGDQSSYLRHHIPTAEILATIATELEFEKVEIAHWRKRWSTTTSLEISENILILQKV